MENRTEIHFVGKKWRGEERDLGQIASCFVPVPPTYVLEIGSRASSMLGADMVSAV